MRFLRKFRVIPVKKRLPLVVVILFLLVYLWPLKNYQTTMASYPGDPYAHAATLSWMCRSFFKGEFHIPYFFAPTGVDGALNYDHPLLSLLTCPLETVGPVAQFNFLVILQVLLISFISLAVSSRYLKNRPLQVAFVFAFGFSTYYVAKVYQYINLLTLIWGFAATFLLFDSLKHTIKKNLLTGILLGAICLSGYVTIPIIVPLIFIFFIYHLHHSPEKVMVIRSYLIITLTALITWLPLSYPMLKSVIGNPPVPQLDKYDTWNADITSFVIPFKSHLLFPQFSSLYQNIINTKGHYFEPYVALEIAVIIVGLYLLLRHKHLISKSTGSPNLLIIAYLYFLLSIGSQLTLAGATIINNPLYSILSQMMPFSINRAPARYAIGVVFALTLLVFRALDHYQKSHRHSSLANITVLAVIISTTIFSQNLQIPHFNYSQILPLKALSHIKNDPDAKMVLHIPLAIQSDQSQNLLRFYHQKPIPSGLISYLAQSPKTLSHIDQDEVLSQLSCSHNLYPYSPTGTINQYTASDLITHLKTLGFDYLILNQTYIEQPECADFALYLNRIIKPYVVDSQLPSTRQFQVYSLSN